jgi:transcriptional regulator
MEKKTKFLKICKQTHTRLQNLGKKGETFDHIIQRLLDEAEKNG